MSFTTGIDIINRALQYVGAPRITTLADDSKSAAEAGFLYPLVRQAELSRSVWRSCIRRAVLRPYTATTLLFVAPLWATAIAYTPGLLVQDSAGLYWICMVANTASATNAPGTYAAGHPQYWQQWFGTVWGDTYSHTVSYYAGELLYDHIGGSWYISTINNNIGNDISGTPSSPSWVAQLGFIWGLYFFTPVGPGVTINGVAQNVFPLPYGYLRVTNQGPKVGSTATNVVSAGLRFSDWQFEANYIVSASTKPIIFRYVADVADVTLLSPLLCEALACRVAYALCETLTQSQVKAQQIAQAYNKFMHDARMIDLIELGSTEDEEEPYLLTTDAAGVTRAGPQQAQAQ